MFWVSGQAHLVALYRWSHSDTVSFHLNNLFAASHVVIDNTRDFTCDSSLEMKYILIFRIFSFNLCFLVQFHIRAISKTPRSFCVFSATFQ